MKEASDSTICVVDGGLFFELSLVLARQFKRVLYQCLIEETAPRINTAVIGDGFSEVERIQDFWPIKNQIDVFCFPDCSFPGLQLELESQGKAVWGSRNGAFLEWNRREFMEKLKGIGLPSPKYDVVIGLAALRDYLEDKEDFYVKISKYRGSFETKHWVDQRTSSDWFDELAIEFGGVQNDIEFLCFPNIIAEVELGYDGYFCGDRFP